MGPERGAKRSFAKEKVEEYQKNWRFVPESLWLEIKWANGTGPAEDNFEASQYGMKGVAAHLKELDDQQRNGLAVLTQANIEGLHKHLQKVATNEKRRKSRGGAGAPSGQSESQLIHYTGLNVARGEAHLRKLQGLARADSKKLSWHALEDTATDLADKVEKIDLRDADGSLPPLTPQGRSCRDKAEAQHHVLRAAADMGEHFCNSL